MNLTAYTTGRTVATMHQVDDKLIIAFRDGTVTQIAPIDGKYTIVRQDATIKIHSLAHAPGSFNVAR